MQINDTLKTEYASTLDSLDELDALEAFVDTLPDTYQEALSDEIRERRAELDDSPALNAATTAELIKHLEQADEQRDQVLKALTSEGEEEESGQDGQEDSNEKVEDNTEGGEDNTDSDMEDSEDEESGGIEATTSGDTIEIDDSLDIDQEILADAENFRSVRNALQDAAERLGCEVSDEDNLQALSAKINEASSSADISVSDLNNAGSNEPTARDQLRRLTGLRI
jgi:hypothetical protein